MLFAIIYLIGLAVAFVPAYRHMFKLEFTGYSSWDNGDRAFCTFMGLLIALYWPIVGALYAVYWIMVESGLFRKFYEFLEGGA